MCFTSLPQSGALDPTFQDIHEHVYKPWHVVSFIDLLLSWFIMNISMKDRNPDTAESPAMVLLFVCLLEFNVSLSQ